MPGNDSPRKGRSKKNAQPVSTKQRLHTLIKRVRVSCRGRRHVHRRGPHPHV
jgi:hypothetical protein